MSKSGNLTEREWLTRIQALTGGIRSWSGWHEEPLRTMRLGPSEQAAGSLALYSYALYVRRFMLIMCDVLSKAPDADDRFWRLAVNLYDEFGANIGFSMAHSKLIEGAKRKPDEVQQEAWDECGRLMSELEESLVSDFRSLRWPLNLFALGPGTESISDLFLDPLENWAEDVLGKLPEVREYFEVHRPDVEHEHQLEISRVLAEELADLPEEKAISLFAQGTSVAERVAKRHLQAICLCWEISAGLNHQYS